MAELIGDRQLEELRRTKRNPRRKGKPRPLADVLPQLGGPMPRPTVEEEAS